MKAAIKDELTIPKQTRYLVPIELGRVERHVCVCMICSWSMLIVILLGI
jgi:hypothetical protein